MSAIPTKIATRKRRVILIVIGIVAALLLAIGFFFVRFMSDKRAATNQTQTGDIVTAFIGDLSASATASGYVEAEQVAVLSTNTPGVITEVLVREGTAVDTGDPLVRADTSNLILQLEKAQQNVALKEANLEALLEEPQDFDVDSAQAAVESAHANLADLLAGPDENEIAESAAKLRQQRASVTSAAGSYQSTIDSISQASLASAEAELINAQIFYDQAADENRRNTNGSTHEAMLDAAEKLAIARAKYEELKAGANQGKLSSASADISAASANLAQAEADHALLLSGSQADQIAAGEAALAQARANLAALLDGPTPEEIAIAQAELEQAKLVLLDAQKALSKATIRAPFDGEITALHVTQGERATGEVAEIVSDDLRIILNVDEIDVGLLAPGQTAIITLEAWPERDIPGEITSIAPSAGNDGQGIVTYDVQIKFEEPDDIHILIGMTANARLITANSKGVLLVPNAAITADRQKGTYWVNLVTEAEDGTPATEEAEVIIGFKDDDYTQIISGLSEGDRVMVGELEAPTIRFDSFRNDD